MIIDTFLVYEECRMFLCINIKCFSIYINVNFTISINNYYDIIVYTTTKRI